MEVVKEPEVWKDIPGYEGLYQVSSWGNVKSFDIMINHYSGIQRVRKGKILTLKVYSKTMYPTVVLCKNKKRKRFPVHLLVLELFVSLKPSSNHKGNHKDLDRLNNYYKNLEWVTVRENTSHYYCSISKKSKFVGVTFDASLNRKKKWRASIYVQGVNINLGRFNTENDAHQAYLKALKKYNILNRYTEKDQSN